ncbi:MAG: recombinase family protein [Candidatus Rokuibacteriota bacterium]
MAPRPPFGALIVSEQSRLGRDTVRTLALIQTLEDSGLQVWAYLDDARIALAEDTDEVREFIKGWAGAQERRKAGQRTRDAMRLLAEQGKSTGGRLYGSTNGAKHKRRAFTTESKYPVSQFR